MEKNNKKKRKSKTSEADGADPPNKIAKVENGDIHDAPAMDKTYKFDLKHFRKELASKTNKLAPLTQFLNVINSDTSVDHVSKYLECGGTPGEILNQLDYKIQKNAPLNAVIFAIFQHILNKIQDSIPHLLQSIEDSCRYFLNTYVPALEFMLGEKCNNKQQKVTLKLLTSIVGLNPELGVTVLSQLSFQSKTMGHLLKREAGKEKSNVRKAFISFLLSFLIDNNMSLIKALMDKHGLLTSIIPDLVKDEAEVVVSVIQLLNKSILNNVNVSKTAKISTFTHYIISCLFNLFNWKAFTKADKAEAEERKKQVEDNVCDFLEILCSSNRFGIYFIDKTMGTGEILTNPYLWKAFEALDAPWNNPATSKLLIKIVQNSPDLFKPIRQLVEESLDVKSKDRFISSVEFFEEILTSLEPSKMVNFMSEMSINQIATFLKYTYLPASILKSCVEAIKSNDFELKNKAILLLNLMMTIIKRYLTSNELNDIHDGKIKAELKIRMEEYIIKQFPTTDTLVMVMHNILDEVSSKESEDEGTITRSQLLINILNLLLMHNDVESNSLDPISTLLDTKRLFDKIDYIKDNKIELKLKTTMFLLRADKFAFAPDKPLFKDIMSGMLEVFTSDDRKMAEEAEKVLYNILDTTGIFESNRYEIDVLLHTILSVNDKSSMVIDLLENIISNRDKYYSIHNKSLGDQDNVQMTENFDEIFSNIENYHKSIKEAVYIHDSRSLSYFITGIFKCNKVSKKYECYNNFVNRFVLNLLHLQDNPDNVWNVLKNYELNEDLQKYVFGWQKKSIGINKNLIQKSEMLYKLSKILLIDESKEFIDLFGADNSMSILDCHIALNMVLFYSIRQMKLDQWNSAKSTKSVDIINLIFEQSLRSFDSNNYIRMLSRILGNKDLIEDFSPLEIGKKHIASALTEFVLKIIEVCNKIGAESKTIMKMLKPYKYRMYLKLSSEITNNISDKNGSKIHNLDTIFSIIKLDLSDGNILLKIILELETRCLVTDNNEPSSWIQLICYILNQNVKENISLSSHLFNKIMDLYSRLIKELDFVINVSDLEESIYNYLIVNPNLMSDVPMNVFEDLFSIKYVSKFTSKLGSLLLQSNVGLISKYIKIIVKADVLDKREFVLPFTSAALCHNKMKYNSDVLKTIYDHYKPNIMKIIEKPQKATQIYIDNVSLIVRLIYEYMEVSECALIFKKVQKYDVTESFHINILEAIFIKFTYNDPNKVDLSCLNNFILCILNMATNSLKRDDINTEKISKISTLLKKMVTIIRIEDIDSKLDFKSILDNTIWLNFYKQVLLSHLKPSDTEIVNSTLFNNLCDFIELIYPVDHSQILELFEMVSSHSEFLNIMLNNRSSNKTQIIQLLYALLNKNKSVIKPNHIPLFLSAYQASVNGSDRTLLKILKIYESNGQSMSEYRPFLWGEAGSNHFALRINRKKASLWSNPTVNHVLNLIDKEKIEKTIKNFNIHAKLIEDNLYNNEDYSLIDLIDSIENINRYGLKKNFKHTSHHHLEHKLNIDRYKCIWNKINNEESFMNDDNKDIYDVSFILPLLNYILSPGSSVSCHRIIRGGILSIPLMSLSCYCPKMRAAAYNILFRFNTHLEAELFYKNDKLLWAQFLNTLRISLDSAIIDMDGSSVNPRLPTVCALYLARAALVMTTPLDPLFKPINNFIISKQQINFTLVPDFLDLFHNSDVAFMERRIWILEVLRDGMKIFSDVKLLFKSVMFKILFDFYSCNLVDMRVKLLIIEIVNNVVRIPKAAKILADAYGLFPWLSTVCKALNNDQKNLISKVVYLVQNLLVSLMTESTSAVLNGKKDNADLLISGKCCRINEAMHNHILCLLVDLLPKITGSAVDVLSVYLNVLRKLSDDSLKLLSKQQMLKLIGECENVADLSKMFTKSAAMAVESKKLNCFLASKMLIDRKTDLNEKDIVIKRLQEVVQNWLS